MSGRPRRPAWRAYSAPTLPRTVYAEDFARLVRHRPAWRIPDRKGARPAVLH